MRLKDAARRFNDALATDAYTGEELFDCAFTSYDDHSSTGATARRRVLSLPEGTVPPLRRAINLFNEIWLVGDGAADSFGGSVVRTAYTMKRATDLASIGTPGAALTNTGLTQAFVQKLFFKDTYNTLTTADSNIGWNVFLAPSETIGVGSFVVIAEGFLQVRRTYLPVEGLLVAECDEAQANALQTAVFIANGTYNSATDSYAVVSTSTPVYMLDYNQDYRRHTAADGAVQPGDQSVLVPKSALTPLTGAQFTMAGSKWRVLSVQSELDCWLLHARVG